MIVEMNLSLKSITTALERGIIPGSAKYNDRENSKTLIKLGNWGLTK
jgi:hypothetical protein